MKITERDQHELNSLINSYSEARRILKIKQDEILKLSKELDESAKELHNIREAEQLFVTKISKRENVDESIVINEILKSLKINLEKP